MTDALAERRALKDSVLEAALLHAAFDGWSRRTLHHAAQDAGLDVPTARRLFPQGGDSLLAWLDDWADRRMVEALAGIDLHKLPVRRRIALLVRTMNSYYSNLIEGHKTLPRDIERAQRRDYSTDPVKKKNQLLTQAH